MEKHILMIEDNEGDVLLAKEAFNQSKIKIRISVATDGAAGILWLENQLGGCKMNCVKEGKTPTLIQYGKARRTIQFRRD